MEVDVPFQNHEAKAGAWALSHVALAMKGIEQPLAIRFGNTNAHDR